jgi:predicted SnoaL-like aldol condensation-catalyzing enzyme
MTSQEQENKALVRRFIEDVYNRRNLDAADELLAPDFVDHGVSASKEGYIEAYKQDVADMLASSSDFHLTIEDNMVR